MAAHRPGPPHVPCTCNAVAVRQPIRCRRGPGDHRGNHPSRAGAPDHPAARGDPPGGAPYGRAHHPPGPDPSGPAAPPRGQRLDRVPDPGAAGVRRRRPPRPSRGRRRVSPRRRGRARPPDVLPVRGGGRPVDRGGRNAQGRRPAPPRFPPRPDPLRHQRPVRPVPASYPPKNAGRTDSFPSTNSTPRTRLNAPTTTPTAAYTAKFLDALRNPYAAPRVITELETRSPSRNALNTAMPTTGPPAPAAARKIRTWVGVSAPTPWIIPTPAAVLVP